MTELERLRAERDHLWTAYETASAEVDRLRRIEDAARVYYENAYSSEAAAALRAALEEE